MRLLVNWSGLWFGVVRHEYSPSITVDWIVIEYCDVYSFVVLCSPYNTQCIMLCVFIASTVAFCELHWKFFIWWVPDLYTVCPSTPHCHSTRQTRWTEHCTVYMFAYVINCKCHWPKNCIQLHSTRILTRLRGRTQTLPGMHGHNEPTTCITQPSNTHY